MQSIWEEAWLLTAPHLLCIWRVNHLVIQKGKTSGHAKRMAGSWHFKDTVICGFREYDISPYRIVRFW